MGVELVLWLAVTLIGVGGIVFGLMGRQYFVFVLGCALLIGSGALLWGADGLIVDTHPVSIADSGAITYENVVVPMSNVGLAMLALVLIASGVLFILGFDFGSGQTVRRGTFHY